MFGPVQPSCLGAPRPPASQDLRAGGPETTRSSSSVATWSPARSGRQLPLPPRALDPPPHPHIRLVLPRCWLPCRGVCLLAWAGSSPHTGDPAGPAHRAPQQPTLPVIARPAGPWACPASLSSGLCVPGSCFGVPRCQSVLLSRPPARGPRVSSHRLPLTASSGQHPSSCGGQSPPPSLAPLTGPACPGVASRTCGSLPHLSFHSDHGFPVPRASTAAPSPCCPTRYPGVHTPAGTHLYRQCPLQSC